MASQEMLLGLALFKELSEEDQLMLLGGEVPEGISPEDLKLIQAFLDLVNQSKDDREQQIADIRDSGVLHGAGASASYDADPEPVVDIHRPSIFDWFRQNRTKHPLTGAEGTRAPEDQLPRIQDADPDGTRLGQPQEFQPSRTDTHPLTQPSIYKDQFYPSHTDTHPLTQYYGMAPGDLDSVLGVDAAFIEARQSANDFLIALDSSNKPVSYNDPNAVRTVFYIDYLREMQIDPLTNEGARRAEDLLKLTQWWNETSSWTQNFQQDWFAAGDAQRAAMIEPTINEVEQILRETGNVGRFTQSQVFEMARSIQELGLHRNLSDMRRAVLAYDEMDLEQSATSAIAQSAFDYKALARDYFMPLSDEAARNYAEQIYVGDITAENLEMLFREQAMARFPSLAGFINDGFTLQDYFAPYESEMEAMLDRQVTIFDEFSEIIDYVPQPGSEARPMTFSEMREFTRRLPEWKHSTQGQNSAKLFAHTLGQMFGEVA